MKKNIKENRKKNFSIWILVIIVVAFIIYLVNERSDFEIEQLQTYPGETTGIIFKYGPDGKGHPMVWYSYTVDGRKFKSFSKMRKFGDSDFDSSHIGEKYKVIYSTKEPKISRIDFDSPVKDE